MQNFVNIGNGDPDQNWWELNPWMKYFKPYNEVYEKVKESSKWMWVIFFLCDPDEEQNKYYRMTEKERIEMLSETYLKKHNWNDPLFVKCKQSYPFDCMSAVKRAYKQEKDQLVKRAQLIADTELTLDHTDVVEGKMVTIKGTATQINTLQKDALKVYENYEKIEAKFIAEKETIKAKGGARISKGEKKGFF